jgi:hypothetical protein
MLLMGCDFHTRYQQIAMRVSLFWASFSANPFASLRRTVHTHPHLTRML